MFEQLSKHQTHREESEPWDDPTRLLVSKSSLAQGPSTQVLIRLPNSGPTDLPVLSLSLIPHQRPDSIWGGGGGRGPPSLAPKLPMHACSVAQSCLTLCDPTDCSPPGSSVHEILQARILEWVVISSSRESYPPLTHFLHWQADSLLLSHLRSPPMLPRWFQRVVGLRPTVLVLFVSFSVVNPTVSRITLSWSSSSNIPENTPLERLFLLLTTVRGGDELSWLSTWECAPTHHCFLSIYLLVTECLLSVSSWEIKTYAHIHVLLPVLQRKKTVRRSNQSILKEINSEYSLEGLCWSRSSNTLATWCEDLTHWKRPGCWESLRTEEGDREWHSWMAALTQWTWVWANFERQWRTGKPCVLQSMGLQRGRHERETEQPKKKEQGGGQVSGD